MKVILLERLKKLGALGDEVSVANGFARNYLIPHGKAVRANAQNRAHFEGRRQALEVEASATYEAAKVRALQLEPLEVVIMMRTTQEDRLYGSVGTKEIAEAITEAGGAVTSGEVVLNDGTLRETGQHKVQLQLHPDVSISLDITIQATTE